MAGTIMGNDGLWVTSSGADRDREEVERRNAAIMEQRRQRDEDWARAARASRLSSMSPEARRMALADIAAEQGRRFQLERIGAEGRTAVDLQNSRNQGLVDVARVTPVALGGGAGVTPRFDIVGNPVGWDRTDPEPPDLSAQYEHELAMQGLRNEGAERVARANGEAAAALQTQKNEGAAQTATIKADAQRDAATIKAEGAKAIREMERTPEGAAAVGGAREAAARTGKAQGINLGSGGIAVIMPDGSSYIVDMRGQRTDYAAPGAQQPPAQPPAQPPPAGSSAPADKNKWKSKGK